jgi:catechol 2,3-dioxygenase-like lactoylglutathione lyase family enzyme
MTTTTSLVTGTDFITVGTKNFDAAVKFYGDVLGLPESKRWGDMPAAEFETGNLTIAVMESEAFGVEFRANNHPIELRVDDVAAARSELESRGVTFEADTLDSGVCHQAFFADPDGNALAVHHRYAPAGVKPESAP